MAKRIDWYYRRNNCTTCAKSDAYLEAHGLKAKETVDARKEKLGKPQIAAILRGTNRVVATKGKKVLDFDLKRDPPVEKVLYESLLGPTGHLRAPALRSGKVLLIGFDEDAWKDVLG